jgi:hypothetical protein
LSNTFGQNIKFGFGGGLNYYNQYIDHKYADGFKYKPGFQLNALIVYSINNRLEINFEPGYSKKGTSQPDYNINLNYINLPVLFKYSLINKLSIIAGPEFAYRISAKAKSDDYNGDLTSLYDSDFDLGGYLGLSYKLTEKLGVDVLYNRGFVSTMSEIVFTDEFNTILDRMKIYNQGFVLKLGYVLK